VQANAMMQSRRGASRQAMPKGLLGRTARYLFHYSWQAALPYLFLLVATLSQLMVPRMVRNIIDAVTNGVIAQQVLEGFAKIPANFLPMQTADKVNNAPSNKETNSILTDAHSVVTTSSA